MAAQTTSKGKLSTYFKGVKAEMRKVIWPNKKRINQLYWGSNYDKCNYIHSCLSFRPWYTLCIITFFYKCNKGGKGLLVPIE